MAVLWGVLAALLLSGGLLWFLWGRAMPADGARQNRIGDGVRRLNANKLTYAVMTETLLMETPDDQLLEAVLSNLWAKMLPDMSDAPLVLARQTLGRRYVFALYAVTGGVRRVGFGKVKAGPDAELVPVCAEALDAIGAAGSADVFRRALAAADSDAYRDAYLERFEGEEGRAKMVAFIRAHPEWFYDLI